MPRRFLYIIRHGQYDFRVDDELGGGLTDLGREQARCVADALRHLPVRAVHCSSMRRARETAEIIIASAFPQVSLRQTRALWECIPSIPPRFADHFTNRPDITPESTAECRERLDKVFARYFRPARETNKHELIVCHGNVTRYFVCRAIGAHPDTWANILIHNCGISRIQVEPDGSFFLISHNDIGHLPPHLLTE